MQHPLIETYFARLNAQDVDGLVALFHREAHHSGPLAGQTLKGLTAIRAFAEGFLDRVPNTRWEVRREFAAGPEIAVVWQAWARGPQGDLVPFEGVHVFTLDEDRLIQILRIFWDPLPVIKALNLQ